MQASSLRYRLKQLDFDRSYEYSDEILVENLLVYALHQNYPNPFNPITRINYSIPVKSKITLVIINPIGEEITTLINEIKEPGRYEEIWNAEGLTSGTYFYALQAESYIETKMMILMK